MYESVILGVVQENMAEDKDPNSGDRKMSFGDHLEELRRRLGKAILASLAVFVVVMVFHEEVMRLVVMPYLTVARDLKMNTALTQFGVTQGFFAYMKVCIIAAVIVAAPIWIYQFWRFVGVGLYKDERRWIMRFFPLMIGLFLAGVSFGYSVLIPTGLRYLLDFRDPTIIQNVIGLAEYLSFFILLTLVLGLTFQLPVAMVLFARLELITVETFREKRRYFILAAFILGALLTPPDVVTQILLATPLLFLYEFGISLAWFLSKGERRINWSAWGRRALVCLGLAGAVWLGWDSLHRSYRQRKISASFRSDSQDSDSVPYFQLFELSDKIIPFEIEFAYRILENDHSALWAVVGQDSGMAFVRLKFSDARVTVTSKEKDLATRFLLTAASQSVVLERVVDLPGAEFVPQLLEDLGDADTADAHRLAGIMSYIVGERPESVPELSSSPTDEEIQRVTDGWRIWWKGNQSWTYKGSG